MKTGINFKALNVCILYLNVNIRINLDVLSGNYIVETLITKMKKILRKFNALSLINPCVNVFEFN